MEPVQHKIILQRTASVSIFVLEPVRDASVQRKKRYILEMVPRLKVVHM